MAGIQIKHRRHAGLNHQKSVLLYRAAHDGLRIVELDEPVRRVARKSTTSSRAMQPFTNGSSISSNGSGTTRAALSRTSRSSRSRRRPRSRRCQQPAKPTSPQRSLFSGKVATSPTSTTSTSGRQPIRRSCPRTRRSDQAISKASARACLSSARVAAGHDVLLACRRQDHGEQDGNEPGLELYDGGLVYATAAADRLASGDIVLYAADATARAGAWQQCSRCDRSRRVASWSHPDAGAAQAQCAARQPRELFRAHVQRGGRTGYRLWIRGKAASNSWANDSLFIQFSGSATSSGAPTWRIGTTSAAEYNLEDCGGCGLVGLGLAGQRLGRRRDGTARLLLDDRHPADTHPDARRRPVHRSGRPVLDDVPELGPGRAEERHDHPAEERNDAATTAAPATAAATTAATTFR